MNKKKIRKRNLNKYNTITNKPNSLKDYGIEYENIQADSESLERDGYKKIPISNISNIMQYIPGTALNHAVIAASEANTKKMLDGAYKVIIKDGMHLAKSKITDGAYRGTLLSDINNQIAGQAELIDIDPLPVTRAPLHVLKIFNMISVVTGQFYLSEINSKLSSIDKQIDKIRNILSDEKKSKLWADERILNQLFDKYKIVRFNSLDKQANLLEIKEIKREVLSNIHFFIIKSKEYKTMYLLKIKKMI